MDIKSKLLSKNRSRDKYKSYNYYFHLMLISFVSFSLHNNPAFNLLAGRQGGAGISF
jgi:hypothetical protein